MNCSLLLLRRKETWRVNPVIVCHCVYFDADPDADLNSFNTFYQ